MTPEIEQIARRVFVDMTHADSYDTRDEAASELVRLIQLVVKEQAETDPLDTWPTPPAGTEGQQVRYRKILGPPTTASRVRIGEAEPKVIVAESAKYVIYQIFSHDGRDLGERVLARTEFDSGFERRQP